jgi:hypothetical protein
LAFSVDRDLVRLNIGKNHMAKIPREALVPLRYLKILEFAENRIESIEAGDFEGEPAY